jgi:uncharacterized protein YkwD
VTLGLALVVGLSGVALGTYVLWNNQVVAEAGPSLAVPTPGDGTGSVSPSTVASISGDPSQQTQTSTPSAPTTTVTTEAATSTHTTATANPATAAPASNANSYEQQVFALTNAQRTTNGCPVLTWNSTLATAARAHSQDMATKNYFDHNSLNGTTTPAQRLTAAGYVWRQMAENIAAGQATPADVVATWMGSAGHRANILNCSLKDIGVGFATGGTYGTYWTQDFGAR